MCRWDGGQYLGIIHQNVEHIADPSYKTEDCVTLSWSAYHDGLQQTVLLDHFVMPVMFYMFLMSITRCNAALWGKPDAMITDPLVSLLSSKKS